MNLTLSRPDAELHSDWQVHYPFTSHFLPLSDSANRVHYLDEGRGEVLLFSHGNPTWSFHWRHLIAGMRDQTRCVAPDHLGSGLSTKSGACRLQDHIDHLVQLVEHLDLRGITLVAQDWGGAIGIGAALAAPERFRRFVLLNTGAFPPWFIPWRIRLCRTPLLGRTAVQGMNLFARAALRMTMSNPGRLTPSERAGYLAPYPNWSSRAGIYQFVADIPRTPGHPTWQTLARIEQGLAGLAERPVQMIWGMRDWCFTPACLDKFLEYLPEADVLRIADAGHWVVEDAREQVLAQIRTFLDDDSRDV